jgi:predicted CXXCH cytochrome family protein
MKKVFVILSIFALLSVSMTALAGTIVGSAHDFSDGAGFNTDTWNASGEICKPCHTPHNATTTAPLWNHNLTTSAFTLYSSATMTATMAQPAGVSKVCLSCHDGTVSLNAYGGGAGGGIMLTGNANVGTDLSNDHPVSFTYDAALATADGELFNPVTQGALGGTIDTKMLNNHKLECSSCHDVHNTSAVGDNLLLITTADSALCLQCHNK